ncbi:hypothetical protein GGR51DRAFT_321148 [Nemania sp. FL0031]|nr:hypothetical protein GGR51DRAFT_321148 [Nemania sp. FL0031]
MYGWIDGIFIGMIHSMDTICPTRKKTHKREKRRERRRTREGEFCLSSTAGGLIWLTGLDRTGLGLLVWSVLSATLVIIIIIRHVNVLSEQNPFFLAVLFVCCCVVIV